MTTQYYVASSLDGFIADAQHSLDWLFQLGQEADADIGTFLAGVGALAMGSSTYEWLLRHHVKPGQADAQPWPYTQPCWVFSSRELPGVAGADIRFVRGDVRPVHADIQGLRQRLRAIALRSGEGLSASTRPTPVTSGHTLGLRYSAIRHQCRRMGR